MTYPKKVVVIDVAPLDRHGEPFDTKFKLGDEFIALGESASGLDYDIDGQPITLSKRRFADVLPPAQPIQPETQTILPLDAKARKGIPVTTGVLDYFPLAMIAVAQLSKAGNDQHNPGQPLHWARGKSTDHADCLVRHLLERGTFDTDGQRHSAKVAWRALALLQTELEGA